MSPVFGGAGESDATRYKQYLLNDKVGAFLGASKAVADKWHPRQKVVIDMTAGPGYSAYGAMGSPLILAEHARRTGHELWCVERNAETRERLEQNLREAGYTALIFNDQAMALNCLHHDALGLTYWDPNKWTELEVELLKEHGRRHRYVDVLMTRPFLQRHRISRAGYGVSTAEDYFRALSKSCGYVGTYHRSQWWAILFFSNWKARPPHHLRGLYDIELAPGRAVLAQLQPGLEPE